MLHEEYHKSTVGEDGGVPLDALGSPPQTGMGSSFIRGHLQTWRTQYQYRDDQQYTSTREHGIQTCLQLQGLLKRVRIRFTQSPPMQLWIAWPNVWRNFYPEPKTQM